MANPNDTWWQPKGEKLPYCDEAEPISLEKLTLQLELTEPENERLLVKYNTLRSQGLYWQLKARLKNVSPVMASQIEAFNYPINPIEELMEIESSAPALKRDIDGLLVEIDDYFHSNIDWDDLCDTLLNIKRHALRLAEDYFITLDSYAKSLYRFQSRSLQTIIKMASEQNISALEVVSSQANRDEIERGIFPLREQSDLYFIDYLIFNNSITGYNELTYLVKNFTAIMEGDEHDQAQLLTPDETDMLYDEMKRFHAEEMDRIYGNHT